jgi:hypothetical protein
MGLGSQAIDAISREHAYRPITGDVLFIGRQTTYFTPPQLVAHLRSHGIDVDQLAIEIDHTIAGRLNAEFVTDSSIFRALGNKNVRALDASSYEGAEIVHDLNRPCSARYSRRRPQSANGGSLGRRQKPPSSRDVANSVVPISARA